MYSGSSKHGRMGGGAGRGASKLGRPSFPPSHRSSANRLSLGGGRNSAATPSSAAPPAVEEKFSLVSGNNPVAFSMIIRLVPDLVDEIRRVEAQGGTPRIKFDSFPNNPTNPDGNVIDVGGKEFRFTWSRDGDLCDTYEERETGEKGNGLLVESGCAWRKVNVQRTLDESATNHYKRQSEEAQRKHKPRKAIVLEPNPAMKNQLKPFAASRGNSSRMTFNKKKEPPLKKQKVEPPQAPPKSANKPRISSATTAKGRQSSSPLPSTPEKSVSPFQMVNISKTPASVDDTVPSQINIKDKPATSFDKETSIRTNAAGEIAGKGNGRAKPTDLQSLLITLLMQNPKGMSLKGLEKAIGDSYTTSVKKIEPILKQIATLAPPGKYLLKPGVDIESFKKPLFDSRSSPEETPVADDNCDQRPAQVLQLKEKVPSNETEEQGQGQLNATAGEEPHAFQQIDNQQQSPDQFGEKRASDNSETRAGTSSSSGSSSDSDSDSDSDADSDSSGSGRDSGSPSRSRHRSRSNSPIQSGSASSSDSESDVSSNSKEGSDVDVDIISDDDKEPKHQIQAPEPGLTALPIPWEIPDGRKPQSENNNKQDDLEHDAIDIENVDEDTELVVASSSPPKKYAADEAKPCSPEHIEHHDRQIPVDSLFGKTTDKDECRYEQSDSSERMSRGKSKRSLEVKQSDEKSERRKRSKTEYLPQPPASVAKRDHFPEDSHNLSPDIEGSYKGPLSHPLSKADRDGNTEFGSQKGYNQTVSGRYSSESKQSSRKSYDHSTQAKAPDRGERPDRYSESLGHGRHYSEKSSYVHEDFSLRKDNVNASSQTKDGSANEKKVSSPSKEGGGRGKQSMPLDSHYQKNGDVSGKSKEDGQVSSLVYSSSPKDNSRNGANRSPVVNGRGGKLQREVSELELGELREATAEEKMVKKQFERKSSFKQSDNKQSTRDNWVSDFNKAKPAGKANVELGKSSSPDLNSKITSNGDGLVRKKKYEDHTEDLTGSQQRGLQSHSQLLSRVDHSDVGHPLSRSADNSLKLTQNEVGSRHGISFDGYGESNKKAPLSASQHHDSKRWPVPHTNKESKRFASHAMVELADVRKETMLASHAMVELADVRKETMLAEGNDSDRKRRDSSSDENSCSYTKYEKDEPELKGPIKDFAQYKEYVQEYRDKYDSYCSLNNILESYKNDFLKLGKDLEFATGTERYYNILEQLKESYRQCGSRHKRLKKIFVVLHEELKHLKQRIKDFAQPYMKD